MARFIMLTRSAHLLDHSRIESRLAAELADVNWIASYAVLGPYDWVDVFDASGNDRAAAVARLVRSLGAIMTEIWPVTGSGPLARSTATYGSRAAARNDEVKEASEESFPASDPPAWTGATAT